MNDTNDADSGSVHLITPNESSMGQSKSKSSIPTIYPNDYDFDFKIGFSANSTTSRSFVRPPKTLSNEHRNISVPHSLQV